MRASAARTECEQRPSERDAVTCEAVDKVEIQVDVGHRHSPRARHARCPRRHQVDHAEDRASCAVRRGGAGANSRSVTAHWHSSARVKAADIVVAELTRRHLEAIEPRTPRSVFCPIGDDEIHEHVARQAGDISDVDVVRCGCCLHLLA